MGRFFVVAGGLAGAAGVALSAVAAHAGGREVGTAASFLVMHAPALLAIGLFGRCRVLMAGGMLVFLGLVLFSADLLTHQYAGYRLFPMAAPIGGSAMILGWLVIATSAFTKREGR